MSGFRIDTAAVASASDSHEAAGEALMTLAPSQPGAVDGGEGTPHILFMIAGCGLEAEALAQLNTSAANELARIVGETRLSDESSAALLSATSGMAEGGMLRGVPTGGLP